MTPPGVVGAELRGDLREEYVHVRARHGAIRSAIWYGWEVLRIWIDFMRGGDGMVGVLWGDARHAVRSLRRSPGFTLVAAMIIGLGLGANTTIFAALYAVVLDPLPFAEPERVVAIREVALETGDGNAALSYPTYDAFKESQRTLLSLAAWQSHQPTLINDDGTPPQRLRGLGITHEMLPLLGVDPVIGRGFSSYDDEEGAPPTVLISHEYWLRGLGADPAVLERSLRLDGVSYRIVGVLPPSFEGETMGAGILPPASAEIWLPYLNSPVAEGVPFDGVHNVNVVARLAEGATIETAQLDAERVMAMVRVRSATHAGDGVKVVAAHDVVVGEVASTMYMLFGAVTLVLLVAVMNVTNLMLGRATARSREMALRLALGAGRLRLLRLMLAESCVLAVVGGVVGVLIVAGGIQLLEAVDPGSVPRLAGTSVNQATMAFLAISALAVGLALGVVALALMSDGRLSQRLREGGRGLGAGRSRFRRGLVVVQVSGATVLLIGAGLLGRSLSEALRVDPGYRSEGLLTARLIMPTPFVSPDWPEHVAFFREVTATIASLPGVTSAAAAYMDPVDAGWRNGFTFASRPEPEPGRNPSAIFRPITSSYFETIEARIVRGRDFSSADDSDAPGVAIVNEAFVRAFFGDADPLGERLDYGDFWGARPDDYQIVGVVSDIRFGDVTSEPQPAVYFPHAQQPVREMAIVVRTPGDPMDLVPAVRAAVASMRPDLPLDFVSSIEDKLERGSARRRFLAVALGLFAFTSLALATLGLYGVLSFMVGRRTHEIGVRLAIGAQRGRVMSEVVREGLVLVAIGLALGLPLAYGLTRLLETLLFGVTATDPVTATVVPLLLSLAGASACAAPALRAMRVDPAGALRSD
jgi:putative ABC transport system permease protein